MLYFYGLFQNEKYRLRMQPVLIVYFSFLILKNLRSKNPKNFGLLKTTTFMTQTSYYVQHFSSAIPNATMIAAVINSISPVGQKQEITSPSPNATAYRAEKQSSLRRTQPTTLLKIRPPSLLSYLILFRQSSFGAIRKVQ